MTTLTRLYPLLKQLGLDDQKSQEFIETLEASLLEQVATKTDLEKVKAELLVKIEATRSELLRWLFGAWAALFLAILAVFLKLP